MSKGQYRDFSEMPTDVLQRFNQALYEAARKAVAKRSPLPQPQEKPIGDQT